MNVHHLMCESLPMGEEARGGRTSSRALRYQMM